MLAPAQTNTNNDKNSFDSNQPPLRLVLCGFPRLHAAGLRLLLQETDQPITVQMETETEMQAQMQKNRSIDSVPPNLLVVHLGLDCFHTEGEYRKLVQRYPNVPVLVLYDIKMTRKAQQLLRLGARGILPNNATVSTLLLTIKAVSLGRVVDSTRIGNNLPHHSTYQPAASKAPASPHRQSRPELTERAPNLKLTPRQLQVLASLSEGKPNKLIARDLDVSENTVKAHLKSVFRILGARNRTEAVSQANRYNLVA